MKTKEKRRVILRFSALKAIKVRELGAKEPLYDLVDYVDILRWSGFTIRDVYGQLEDNINGGLGGLKENSCVFCLENQDEYGDAQCSFCTYGKRHGVCGEAGQGDHNRWGRIYNKLIDLNNHDELTADFYKKIWDEAHQ